MASSSLRGKLWRKKKDSSSLMSNKSVNVFGVGWHKYYAVLRPDALLLYEDRHGNRPELIIPMKDSEVKVLEDEHQPRGGVTRTRTPEPEPPNMPSLLVLRGTCLARGLDLWREGLCLVWLTSLVI